MHHKAPVLVNKRVYSPLLEIDTFSQKIFAGSLKHSFQNKIILEKISDKNCETRTLSPLIQCWLQICLFISGLTA